MLQLLVPISNHSVQLDGLFVQRKGNRSCTKNVFHLTVHYVTRKLHSAWWQWQVALLPLPPKSKCSAAYVKINALQQIPYAKPPSLTWGNQVCAENGPLSRHYMIMFMLQTRNGNKPVGVAVRLVLVLLIPNRHYLATTFLICNHTVISKLLVSINKNN